MKRIIATCLIGLTAACAYNSEPVQNYPYGMTEKEWNELSIKDKAMIRRDFYFVEKGNMGFVNPGRLPLMRPCRFMTGLRDLYCQIRSSARAI